MKSIYALGLYYVCDPILAPVVSELRRKGYHVDYEPAIGGRQHWEQFLENPGVLLTVCQNATGSHEPNLRRIEKVRRAGGICVGIQHGAYSRPQTEVCDIACIWGPYYDQFISAPKKIITGNPAWDEKPDPAEWAASGYPGRYALFVGSLRSSYSNPALYEEAIAKVSTRLPVIISAHPNEAERPFDGWRQSMCSRYPGVRLHPPKDTGALNSLVDGATLVFGRSTVLVQAACWGIPSLGVQTDPDERRDGKIYWWWGAERALDYALMWKPRDNHDFVSKHNANNGNAAAAVADVIISAAEGL